MYISSWRNSAPDSLVLEGGKSRTNFHELSGDFKCYEVQEGLDGHEVLKDDKRLKSCNEQNVKFSFQLFISIMKGSRFGDYLVFDSHEETLSIDSVFEFVSSSCGLSRTPSFLKLFWDILLQNINILIAQTSATVYFTLTLKIGKKGATCNPGKNPWPMCYMQ